MREFKRDWEFIKNRTEKAERVQLRLAIKSSRSGEQQTAMDQSVNCGWKFSPVFAFSSAQLFYRSTALLKALPKYVAL
jgi:hypothetical protein